MSAITSVDSRQRRTAQKLHHPQHRYATVGKTLGVLALLVVAVFDLFQSVIRPWHSRWGATEQEVSMLLPGDELVPPSDSLTRAVTIKAPASGVFPWLVQMGWERGGLYSYA